MLQFGVSLTDNTSSVKYDRNMFVVQATELCPERSHRQTAWAGQAEIDRHIDR